VTGGIDHVDAGVARGDPAESGLKLPRGDVARGVGLGRKNQDAFHVQIIGLFSLSITWE
jgi:hypothetical protein